jgi:hypothetical protein
MIEKRIDGKDKAPWLRCRSCHTSYWAENWHCLDCHDTFSYKTTFHHSETGCIPPVRFGWDLVDDVWTPK